eukprot:CAMPEP_0179888708 /NCGR_PEP_ID=MMETSP0982-20121206/32122_1 /TAXON_ID=483367 /ORGANISM="non described non described, Strain CCMP 2436" /LENGTH=75 /DNA_ID=CAMNT_0021784701 /DNA_START=443 /DNA_END=670 /DNA_ORIENTATION=+
MRERALEPWKDALTAACVLPWSCSDTIRVVAAINAGAELIAKVRRASARKKKAWLRNARSSATKLAKNITVAPAK